MPVLPESSPGSVTRREFVGLLGALAAAPLSGRGADPPTAAVPSPEPEVNLLAMGDWGAPPVTHAPKDAAILARYQNQVAAALAAYAGSLVAAGSPLQAVLPLGDNFYGGIKGISDPRWIDRFEKLYPATALGVPFHFVLGNHEFEDGDKQGWKNQLAYAAHSAAASPPGRWSFPAAAGDTWYARHFPSAESPLVSMFFLNTNYSDHITEADWARQMKWLDQELAAAAESRWRIVVGHHPMFTDGYHWDGKKDPGLYAELRKTLLPKLKSCVFYISAHDHNLQHIHHPAYPETDFLLSGAGGGDFIKPRRRLDPPYQNHFMAELGFLHVRFTTTTATAQFITPADKGWTSLHTVTRS